MSQELCDSYGIDLTIYFYYKIQNDQSPTYTNSFNRDSEVMWETSKLTANILNWMDKNVGYI